MANNNTSESKPTGARKTNLPLLIFLFLLISLFIQCSAGTNAYLKTYPGVIVKDTDDNEKFIFHNEKLNLISSDSKEGRYRDELTGKKYTIPVKHFSTKENPLFYSVDTKAGLFLRSEPNRSSEKILLMAYKSSGKIIGIQKEFSIIEKIRAPWLQIEYKDKVGWAFAGYIRIFTTESERNEFLKQNDIFETEKFMEADKLSSVEVSELFKITTPRKIYENIDYEILDFRFLYKKNEECSLDKWNQLVYKNKNSNEFFTIKNKAGEMNILSEKITDFDFPINGVIATESTCCWCCCPCHSSRTYFLAKDKPYFIERNIANSFGKASCRFSENMEEAYRLSETETRLINDDSIYTIIKNPPCGYSEVVPKLVKRDPLDLHLLIQLKERKFGYEKKVTSTGNIPEEFKDAFSNSKRVVSKTAKQIDWHKVLKDYNGVND